MRIDFMLSVVLLMTTSISLSTSMSFIQQMLEVFQKNTKIRANLPFNMKSTANLIMRGVESKRCEDALCPDCVPGFCRERPVPPTKPDLSHISINRNGTVNGFPNLTVSALPAAITGAMGGGQGGGSGSGGGGSGGGGGDQGGGSGGSGGGGGGGGGLQGSGILSQSAPFGPGSLQVPNLNQLGNFFGSMSGQAGGPTGDSVSSGIGGIGGIGGVGAGGVSGSGVGGGGVGGSGGNGGGGGQGLLSSDISTTNSTGGPPVISTTLPPIMCQCSWI